MHKIVSKQNKALLSELVRTDFKLRYQGSVLGYAWSLLRPLLIFVILYVVFVKFLKIGDSIPHFPVYLLLGIVIWSFFTEMTQQSLTSIVARGELIRKISIPRWIVVFSSSVSALINLGLNLVVVSIFMLINNVHLHWTIVLVPFLFIEIYLFALGISLFLAALFVKFRDINYIWEVALQAGFYLTPILYPISKITNITFQKLIFMNPVAQVIQDIRYCMITNQSITIHKLLGTSLYAFVPYAIVATSLIVGVLYFRNQADSFAENI